MEIKKQDQGDEGTELVGERVEPPRPALQASELNADHLPWSAEPDPIHGASIRDTKDNQLVAHIYDEEIAAIIVRAVNAHDALVAALLQEASQLETWATESREGGWSTHQVEPMRRRAAELRALATKPKGD